MWKEFLWNNREKIFLNRACGMLLKNSQPPVEKKSLRL